MTKFTESRPLVHHSTMLQEPMPREVKIICEADGLTKLTTITPYKNGYAVAIAQAVNADNTTGGFLGCYLLSPESPNGEGPMLLSEAFTAYELSSRANK